MLWSVYAPDVIRLVHAGGNVETDNGFIALSGVTMGGIRREVAADKEEYLQKAQESMNRGAGAPLSQVSARQAMMELDAADMKDDGAPLENHVLPISFRIPETGHLYRFGKIMVTGEAPTLSLTYIRNGFISVLKYLFIALVAFLVYRRRADLKPMFLRADVLVRKVSGHLRPARNPEAAN